MRITEWKKHFAKIIHKPTKSYEDGKCYDLSGDASVEKQLSKIKGGGNHKIFYFKVKQVGDREFNLELISEKIYVDKPQY